MGAKVIVAWDVTGADPRIAWSDQDGEIHEEALTDRKTARVLLPQVEKALAGRRITAIGVVTGPGSFTGVRTGIATALGIQAAAGVPIYGRNAFEVALRTLSQPAQLVVPAGPGYLFTARLLPAEGRIEDPRSLKVDAFEPDPEAVATSAIKGLDLPILPRTLTYDLAALILSGKVGEPGNPEPYYLKPPDLHKVKPFLQKLLEKKVADTSNP